MGEVGIDASPRYAKSLPEQKHVFERVLKACSSEGGKVLSIHAVRSVSLVLDMLEEHLDLSANTPVLHWFSGSPSEARRAAKLGCMFSINDRMLTGSKAGALMKAIPEEAMLTETDGPFTETDGKASRPKDVGVCLGHLATRIGREPTAVQSLVFENFKRVLGRIRR